MGSETLKQKYSVLVIDDQKNWRELLTEILAEQFEVISASSYDGALEAIRNQKPAFHVVVTDMRLVDDETGNENGLKLIEYLNQRGDETKTIVITGYPTIGTARQALSHLAAYDYLEKRPADGSPFDVKGFQQIVYQAAEEAEKKRPNGLTDITRNILLLEPDPVWRKKLKDSLGENGYRVHAPETDENLVFSLKNDSQRYALILINESLSDENSLASLHGLHPDTRMIMLTSRDIDPIVRAMRDYPVLLTAFNVQAHNAQDEKFDTAALQEFIHGTLAYGAIKYILARIESGDQSTSVYSKHSNMYEMVVGSKYNATLSLQDTPEIGATAIWLSPREEKKGKIQLHVFVHAKQMNLGPGSEAYWNISLSDQRPRPFKFSITPQASGTNEIAIEIDQNHRWLGRIGIAINVKQSN
jgi:ActR/RegA family two-component response regulator